MIKSMICTSFPQDPHRGQIGHKLSTQIVIRLFPSGVKIATCWSFCVQQAYSVVSFLQKEDLKKTLHEFHCTIIVGKKVHDKYIMEIAIEI